MLKSPTMFCPHQCKVGYLVYIQMIDNSPHTLTFLECKKHVKYLGILMASNLSWKFHVEYVALKISRIIGDIASLPYCFYGLVAWGQAAISIYKKSLCYKPRAYTMSVCSLQIKYSFLKEGPLYFFSWNMIFVCYLFVICDWPLLHVRKSGYWIKHDT